jgi:hypothetical protein
MWTHGHNFPILHLFYVLGAKNPQTAVSELHSFDMNQQD